MSAHSITTTMSLGSTRPSRRRMMVGAALIAALGLALGAAVAGPADAASAAVSTAKPDKPGATKELDLAAVGDSFAAGTGGGAYLDSTCDRTVGAYPRLLDADSTANLRLAAFPACAGASTAEVISQQVPTIPRRARLVTVTVGGNDVGFANVMQNCFVFQTSSCATHIANGATIAASEAFASSIRNVVASVRAKAPNAIVVVTGYPLLFDLDDATGTNPEYTWADEVNAETAALNDVIEANATAAGATFVDVEGAFEEHGIGSAAPWINDFSWGAFTDGFHPNATGYVAYANAIRAVLPAA